MKPFVLLALFIALSSAVVSVHGEIPPYPLWNEARAQKLLPLAFATYCPQSGLQDWTCWWCKAAGTPAVKVHGVFHAVSLNVMGYVGTMKSPVDNSNIIVAAFRGTADLVNLLVDLNAAPRPFLPFPNSGAYVHGGFYHGYEVVAPELFSYLQKAKAYCNSTLPGGCSEVRFIGHSLGGALATLAAADQCASFANNTQVPHIRCYLDTYSAPRVGNGPFVKQLNAASWFHGSVRMTHQTDPVPHVPPLFTSYQHLPGEVWQFVDTPYPKFQVCSPSNGEDPNCSDGAFGRFSIWRPSNWTNLIFGVSRYHSNYFNVSLDSSKGICEAFQNNACNLCYSILTIIQHQLKTQTVAQVVENARPMCKLLSPYQDVCMNWVFVLVTAVDLGTFQCACQPGQLDPPPVLQPLFDLFEKHAKYHALGH